MTHQVQSLQALCLRAIAEGLSRSDSRFSLGACDALPADISYKLQQNLASTNALNDLSLVASTSTHQTALQVPFSVANDDSALSSHGILQAVLVRTISVGIALFTLLFILYWAQLPLAPPPSAIPDTVRLVASSRLEKRGQAWPTRLHAPLPHAEPLLLAQPPLFFAFTPIDSSFEPALALNSCLRSTLHRYLLRSCLLICSFSPEEHFGAVKVVPMCDCDGQASLAWRGGCESGG